MAPACLIELPYGALAGVTLNLSSQETADIRGAVGHGLSGVFVRQR